MRGYSSRWDKYTEIAVKLRAICPFGRVHLDWNDVNVPVGHSSWKSHLVTIEKLLLNEWRMMTRCVIMRNGRAVLGEPKTQL